MRERSNQVNSHIENIQLCTVIIPTTSTPVTVNCMHVAPGLDQNGDRVLQNAPTILVRESTKVPILMDFNPSSLAWALESCKPSERVQSLPEWLRFNILRRHYKEDNRYRSGHDILLFKISTTGHVNEVMKLRHIISLLGNSDRLTAAEIPAYIESGLPRNGRRTTMIWTLLSRKLEQWS